MKISPINYNIQPQSFRAIKSATPGVSKEIFGDKEPLFDAISDEKEVDVWAFRFRRGGMVNSQTSYMVLIQNNAGTVIKEIDGPAEECENINKRVEDSLVWYNAKSNFMAANALRTSKMHELNKEGAQNMEKKMVNVAMSPESNTWQQRFDLI